jgi:hypothetical protein
MGRRGFADRVLWARPHVDRLLLSSSKVQYMGSGIACGWTLLLESLGKTYIHTHSSKHAGPSAGHLRQDTGRGAARIRMHQDILRKRHRNHGTSPVRSASSGPPATPAR